MNKTAAAVIGVLVLIVVALALLSRPDNEQAPKLSDDSSAAAVYRLQFGHDMPEDSAQHVSALKFAEIVHYKSKGRLRVEVFPDQQLGTDQEMLEAARRGELAIILPPTAKMTTLVPELRFLDLPFLAPSREDMYELLDGEPGQMLLASIGADQGLVGVTFWESGFKQFTANREIHEPEDFRGLNIRVMKSRTIMDQYRALGANPIPIAFKKTYQALKDGVVDGEENPLVSIVNMKFHEVQSHVVISNHAYLGYCLCFSRKILESLPDDLQEILKSTAIELTPFERKETIEREQRFIQEIKDSGTSVYELTDAQRRLFEEATREVADSYNAIGKPILDKARQLLNNKYMAQENTLYIGLDADMTLGSAPSGKAIKRGMELAIDEINRRGGVLGKILRIRVRDHGGVSARGVANIRAFADTDNLLAVMGGLHSPVALAELEAIHQERVIYLDPWASATRIVGNGYDPNYVFRLSVRDELAGPFLVDNALQGYGQVALLLENTGWGRSNHKAMSNALAAKGKTPVAVEWFNWGEQDMTPQLTRIERAGAEVILLVANAPEGVGVIKSLARRPDPLPVISHWGITGGYFWEQAGPELARISLCFLQTFSFLDAQSDKARALTQKYLRDYTVESAANIVAPVGTAHAYDLIHLLAMAVEQAGSIEAPRVREALENLGDYDGLVKRYRPAFTAERHEALDADSFILAQYNGLGHIVPIRD